MRHRVLLAAQLKGVLVAIFDLDFDLALMGQLLGMSRWTGRHLWCFIVVALALIFARRYLLLSGRQVVCRLVGRGQIGLLELVSLAFVRRQNDVVLSAATFDKSHRVQRQRTLV